MTPADLPPPPPNRSGFPWTVGTAPRAAEAPYRITVVTPSYNQGQFLEEAIRSVLLQGYPNLEYIVIDGGSSDGSRAIIEKYAPFLAYWVSEPDKGQANAINKGFARSTGAIMGWLNSDDLLLPDALWHIAEAYQRDPKLMVSCGFRKLFDAESRFLMNWVRGMPNRYQLQRRDVVAQETTYWRREVWERCGGLDESLHFGMDYEYWQRIMANGYHFRLLPHYLGGFRLHEDSKTTNLLDVDQQELKIIFQRYGIGLDQPTVFARMGRLWALRYEFSKDLSHHRLSNNPKIALWLLQVMNHRLISPPLLGLYVVYRRLRRR